MVIIPPETAEGGRGMNDLISKSMVALILGRLLRNNKIRFSTREDVIEFIHNVRKFFSRRRFYIKYSHPGTRYPYSVCLGVFEYQEVEQ